MKKALILFTLFGVFAFGNTLVGSWKFDLKESVKHDKSFEPMYKNLVGSTMRIDKSHNFYKNGRKFGKVKKAGKGYVVVLKAGKKMDIAVLGRHLKVTQHHPKLGAIVMYFKGMGSAKSEDASLPLFYGKVYVQPKKIYDNGYLYYLFEKNGVMYSYVKADKSAAAKEVKTKGTKHPYSVDSGKLYMKSGFMTVTITPKGKKVTTSQGDTLLLKGK